jgi:hypothetical protein
MICFYFSPSAMVRVPKNHFFAVVHGSQNTHSATLAPKAPPDGLPTYGIITKADCTNACYAGNESLAVEACSRFFPGESLAFVCGA